MANPPRIPNADDSAQGQSDEFQQDSGNSDEHRQGHHPGHTQEGRKHHIATREMGDDKRRLTHVLHQSADQLAVEG